MGKKIIAAWICLGLVIVSVSYLFTYQEGLRLNLDRIAHAQEALSLIHDLENNLAAAEAAARGYFINREEGQLQQYQEALLEIKGIMEGLTALTRDEPGHQRLLQAAKPLISQRLGLLEKSITLRREKGLEGPEQAALTRQGTRLQIKIRNLLEKMEELEKRGLAPQWAERERRARLWVWGLAFSTYLGFSLLLLMLYFLGREITARTRAEEKLLASQEDLRTLASQLSLAEERERRRIALHLHDQVGQPLALANIKLGELQQSLADAGPSPLKADLDRVSELLEEAIQDTQSLTSRISPPILYELGLEAALEWLTEQVSRQHGLYARFETDHQPLPLDEDVRVLIFQSVNELLVNAVKHARARNLWVSVRRNGPNLGVAVEDDGVGFEVAALGSLGQGRGGFGLFSIRERLRPFGGQLEVESEPGAGTRVTLTVPLKD